MNTTKVIFQKHGFRQTQQGVVVSYLVDPVDMPDKLATDPLGTMYGAVLVEVDENDQPKTARSSTGSEHRNSTPGVGGSNPPAPAKRSFHDMPRSQQAGMLCQDEAFKDWLMVQHGSRRFLQNPKYNGCLMPDLAANLIRDHFQIETRTRLDEPGIWEGWDTFVARYRQETGQEPEPRG